MDPSMFQGCGLLTIGRARSCIRRGSNTHCPLDCLSCCRADWRPNHFRRQSKRAHNRHTEPRDIRSVVTDSRGHRWHRLGANQWHEATSLGCSTDLRCSLLGFWWDRCAVERVCERAQRSSSSFLTRRGGRRNGSAGRKSLPAAAG